MARYCRLCERSRASRIRCAGCGKDYTAAFSPESAAPPKRSRNAPVPQPVEQVAPVERRYEKLSLRKDEPTVVVEPVRRAGPEKTREEWLLTAVDVMRPWFEEAGTPLGWVRVSVGWPAGRSAKANTIGQCFKESLVADGQPAIFISPVLTDPIEVLSTLVHELVHAALPVIQNPHRGAFVKLAKAVGLTGKWTATVAGEDLKARLVTLAGLLGPFGHAAVSKGGKGRRVQGTRMLKVQCDACGCVVRMTRKWLDEVGAPRCGCGDEAGMAEVGAE